MGKLFQWINQTLTTAESRLSLFNYLFGPAGLIGMSSLLALWATYATESLRANAPASYVIAILGAAFVVSCTIALKTWARDRMQVIKFRDAVHQETRVNPLEDTFRKQRIRLTDLSPPIGGLIVNKNFIDCEILGPANALFFQDCIFKECGGEAVDAIILKLEARPRNGFGFGNCTFKGCKFYLVTFMVPLEMYPGFRGYNWTGLNWVTVNPDDLLLVSDQQQDAESGHATKIVEGQ